MAKGQILQKENYWKLPSELRINISSETRAIILHGTEKKSQKTKQVLSPASPKSPSGAFLSLVLRILPD